MAVHALWQDKYALSFRQGPIDLSKILTSDSTTSGDEDAASHNNVGAASDVLVSTVEYGGDRHFDSSDADNTSYGQGFVQGQLQTFSGPTLGSFRYGQPVTGNPTISPGQNILDFRKTNGDAIGRIAGTTNETSNADAYRGGQSPTFSCETIPTSKSLTSLMGGFFQNGLKEDSGTDAIKVARFPKASDGSDPKWVGTWLRQMSAAGADSHLLSDCVATSLNLAVNTDGILTASTDWVGRIMVTDAQASTLVGGSSAADTTLDDGRNYLMQDAQCLISNSDKTAHFLTEISDFSLNMSSNVGIQRYNGMFPLRYVMGDYTAEGSITIPWSSGFFGSAGIDQDYFYRKLTTAGSTGETLSSALVPLNIGVFWQATGFTGASGSAQTLPTAIAASRDLHIVLSVVVTDVQVVGDVEAELQVSFRCLNKYSGSTLSENAVKIAAYDDLAGTWGYTQAATLYGTATA